MLPGVFRAASVQVKPKWNKSWNQHDVDCFSHPVLNGPGSEHAVAKIEESAVGGRWSPSGGPAAATLSPVLRRSIQPSNRANQRGNQPTRQPTNKATNQRGNEVTRQRSNEGRVESQQSNGSRMGFLGVGRRSSGRVRPATTGGSDGGRRGPGLSTGSHGSNQPIQPTDPTSQRGAPKATNNPTGPTDLTERLVRESKACSMGRAARRWCSPRRAVDAGVSSSRRPTVGLREGLSQAARGPHGGPTAYRSAPMAGVSLWVIRRKNDQLAYGWPSAGCFTSSEFSTVAERCCASAVVR